MDEKDSELAGPTQKPEPDVPDTAREVRPLSFEKDDLDFRGLEEVDSPMNPKASTAPVSVAIQQSVTGLEDVSLEDLEKTVPTNVEKDKNTESTESQS